MTYNLGLAVSNLDVLADANDQFHWGAKVEAVAAAVRNLRARNLNPILAELLEGKIASMEAVEAKESLHALRVAPSGGLNLPRSSRAKARSSSLAGRGFPFSPPLTPPHHDRQGEAGQSHETDQERVEFRV